MYKENGREKPADKKEKANTKTVSCPKCDIAFRIETSTVFGEDILCPACGHVFFN